MTLHWRFFAALSLGSVVGCATGSAVRPLPAGAFTAPPTTPTNPNSPVNRSGVLPIDRPNGEEALPPPSQLQRKEEPEKTSPIEHLSRVVRENVPSPTERGEEIAATRPELSRFTSPTSGQYLTIGGVIAEVNGTPIYADKVLAEIVPVLAARAPHVSRAQFHAIATQEIEDQVQDHVKRELYYAAALRNLDSQDKKFADALTQDWRKHRIAEAGGSVELARKLASDRGLNFDELVQEQYRTFMIGIYLQKRIVPRIQVTVDDMRRYYQQHLASEFTKHATARFRLIKINIQQVGDREAARSKIEDIRRRIVKGGEDFASVASTTNDPALLPTGGELTVQRGAFGAEKVEQAVWKTPTGQVTPVIETPDAFYIAKVQQKTKGHVIPFDEEQVQDSIREKLRSEQFRALQQKDSEQLRKESLIRSNPTMLDTAVNMAMENYSLWAARS